MNILEMGPKEGLWIEEGGKNGFGYLIRYIHPQSILLHK